MTIKQSTGLTVESLRAGYDGTCIIEDVTFAIQRGERLGILGRNGAGKTTTLATLMGLTQYQGGLLYFEGQDISRMTTFQRARAGLGYVPQTRDIFTSLSVEENLVAGLAGQPKERVDDAYSWFPRLKERRCNYGNQLSGGEQQMLAVARALMSAPSLLLLDEPLEGLAPLLAEELMGKIRTLIDHTGIGCILVEQHVDVVLNFSTQVLVLERGVPVYQGTPDELRNRPDVLEGAIGLAKTA
ncbi:ABC transporter ATP-binding protein [Chromohalobacter nigrandesensis]|uniref:ABC transporter ATP-binding protein n=1 Tax=Chromohalobacter nigrandesensis TaxID=119863 RepID=UPI001FF1EA62|nr:ABC transporter ATP-binding protein [Chromohalobacter nigrandesensis]MCK0745203.1 ABC transporter ATP-binding protein [Chromohalobacter nigrandesensis]